MSVALILNEDLFWFERSLLGVVGGGGGCCCCNFTKKAINDDCEKSTAKENQDHLEVFSDKLVLLWDKTKTENLYPCVACNYVVLDL